MMIFVSSVNCSPPSVELEKAVWENAGQDWYNPMDSEGNVTESS